MHTIIVSAYSPLDACPQVFLSFVSARQASNEHTAKTICMRFLVDPCPPSGSCLVYVGFVRPGQNAADIVCPWRGKSALISVRRNGEVHDPNRASTATKRHPSSSPLDVDRGDIVLAGEDRCHWESTSIGNGYSPNPDIVFKCVDAGLAAVVGAAVERRMQQRLGGTLPDVPELTEAPGDSRNESAKGGEVQVQPTPSIPYGHQENKREPFFRPERPIDGDAETQQSAAEDTFVETSTTKDNHTLDDTAIGSGRSDADDCRQTSSSDSRRDGSHQPHADAATGSRKSGLALDPAARPQVCVPLAGVGDSGCIGMVGVQGFATGAVVDDEDWRDWFAARMAPLRKGENRAVKRLKLVRPRVLPAQGRLESVPSGTAARVVYGSVEKVSSKRGRPVYTVRCEQGGQDRVLDFQRYSV